MLTFIPQVFILSRQLKIDLFSHYSNHLLTLIKPMDRQKSAIATITPHYKKQTTITLLDQKKYKEALGTVTLKKGFILFHGSPQEFTTIHNNSFFTFDIKAAEIYGNPDEGHNIYIYELIKDLTLLLTVTQHEEQSYLSYILSVESKTPEYIQLNEVNEIKLKRNLFDPFCDKLSDRYEGLFNKMDLNGTYEVVIFNPSKYLKQVTSPKQVTKCVYDNLTNFTSLFSNLRLDLPYRILPMCLNCDDEQCAYACHNDRDTFIWFRKSEQA